MNVFEIVDLIVRYTALRNGQSYTRSEFLHWGAHHGLSRRVPCELVDEAFAELLRQKHLEQHQTPPGSILPAYRRAA